MAKTDLRLIPKTRMQLYWLPAVTIKRPLSDHDGKIAHCGRFSTGGSQVMDDSMDPYFYCRLLRVGLTS